MRRRPGWLRKALQSGELASAAVGAQSLADVAKALGVSLDAFYCAREHLKQDGVAITLESLQAHGIPASAERSLAGGPALAAFDAEPWQPDDFRNPEQLPYVAPTAPMTRKITRDECPDGTTYLWLSDVHIPIQNDPALRLAVECAERIGVTDVIAGGDIFDFNCLSTHPKEAHRVVEHGTVLEEIEPGRWLLDWFAKKRTKLILGNHEGRLNRFIDANPAFHGSVLGNFAQVVNLPAGIEVIPQGGEVRLGSLSCRHLDAEFKRGTGGAHPAAKLLAMLPSQSTIGGHLHRIAMARRTTKDEDGIDRTHCAWLMGHMSHEANHYSYVSTSPNWQTGFGIIRAWWDGDRPRFSVYQIEVLFDRYNRPYFEFDGRLYHQARQVAA